MFDLILPLVLRYYTLKTEYEEDDSKNIDVVSTSKSKLTNVALNTTTIRNRRNKPGLEF